MVMDDWGSANDDDDELFLQLNCDTNKRRNEDTVGRQKRARLDFVGDAEEFINIGTSNNNIITWYYRKNTLNSINYTSFFNSIKSELIQKLQEHVAERTIKFNLKIETEYDRPGVKNSLEDKAFKTKATPVFSDSDIEMLVDEAFGKMMAEENAFTSRGSGFSLKHISGILLSVYNYTPMYGSSYITLPTEIINKKAVIDPQNADQECFKWAILAKHVTVDHKYTFDNHKVADHCHLSGKFRQSLCNNCNLKLQSPNFVPVFFHNLSNYDSHFIIRNLGIDDKAVNIIPNSEEKFISFSKYVSGRFSIRFIDSFRFMEKLAENLKTDDFSKFRVTSKFFKPKDMVYVTKKCNFCYEYIDDKKKLKETALPPKEAFYSTLKEKHIKDKAYDQTCEVWDHFKCKTLGEYSDLYLKVDVLLLTDVFENFIDTAYYFTCPGLSFDAALKYTGIKLELLSSYDMLLMFEKGIRGGLCQASKRYAKANNYKTPDYNEMEPKSWVIYQDCNNLYGFSMSGYIPQGGYKWVKPTLDGLNDLDETSPIGLVYEVDIAYPENLHDKHSELPFLPENKIPPGSKAQKLMATLEPKQNYIIQQAIANGMIVEKSPWLAEYINLNTRLRKKAHNDFEKNYYKLMNNSVFGKTMEKKDKNGAGGR